MSNCFHTKLRKFHQRDNFRTLLGNDAVTIEETKGDVEEIETPPSVSPKNTPPVKNSNEWEARLIDELLKMDVRLDGLEKLQANKITNYAASYMATAMPLLSDAFLADEVAQHILRASSSLRGANLMINVPISFKAKLCDAIERHSHLKDRVTICEVDDEDMTSIEVSWCDGGIDFNFHDLIGRCNFRSDDSTKYSIEEKL